MVSPNDKKNTSGIICIREERIKRNLARLDKLLHGNRDLLTRTEEYLNYATNDSRTKETA